MIIQLLQAIIKWILGVSLTSIDEVEGDLNEEARSECKETLREIRKRNKHEVDAKPVRGVAQGVISVSIPKSTNVFITFDPNDIIQKSPELIFGGTFLKQKRLAIKEIGSDDIQLVKELKIIDHLKHHENIHAHFFGFSDTGVNYIAMECYETTLAGILKHPLKLDVDLKNIFGQLCRGVEFMHTSGVAHRSLQLRNISIVMRGQEPVFQITNFRDASKTSIEADFKHDIKDLGKILHDLLELYDEQHKEKESSRRFEARVKPIDSKTHDEYLCVGLIDLMTTVDRKQRPSIAAVKAHPFLWTPSETLHFVVHIVKMLETGDNRLYQAIRKNSFDVIKKDWTKRIDGFVRNELDRIHRANIPVYDRLRLVASETSLNTSIIGLVKQIRNLVSFAFMFLRSKEVHTNRFNL